MVFDECNSNRRPGKTRRRRDRVRASQDEETWCFSRSKAKKSRQPTFACLLCDRLRWFVPRNFDNLVVLRSDNWHLLGTDTHHDLPPRLRLQMPVFELASGSRFPFWRTENSVANRRSFQSYYLCRAGSVCVYGLPHSSHAL
jgi:hypothetical protein